MVARVLEQGMTPAEVIADLRAKGYTISERSLRAKARELGACRVFGKAMILLPEHVDLIFGAPECQNAEEQDSNSTFGATLGGSRVALREMTNTTAKALERLTKRSQEQRSGNSKRKPSNVLSLAETRRNQRSG